MKTYPNPISIGTRQRGAVLVVSMLLLLVMTLLALSMSQTTQLDERMAGNSRDYELAFQGAESALRASEAALMTATEESDGCGAPDSDRVTCPVLQQGAVAKANVDLREADVAWWNAKSQIFGTNAQDIAGLHADPNLVIERAGRANIGGMGIGGPDIPQVRTFYRVTAHSFGKGANTRVINESVVAVMPP